MARGRMINSSVCTDKRINDLSDDTSRLAFTWLITFADKNGRTHGDPALLCSRLFPRRRDVTPETMECYIREWADLGLITWYQANDDLWIEFPAFDRNQPGLRKDREPNSGIPAPQEGVTLDGKVPEDCRQNGGNMTADIPPKRTEEKRTEEKVLSSFLSQCVQSFENGIGLVTGQTQSREIADVVEELEKRGLPDWWQMALDTSLDNNGRSWSYMRAVLYNWLKEGKPSITRPKLPMANSPPEMRVIEFNDPVTGKHVIKEVPG